METIQKKHSVVAFIDILGYKELVVESSGNEIGFFNDLKLAMNIAINYSFELFKYALVALDQKNDNLFKIENRINRKQFSDNVYFSFDYENNDDDDKKFAIYIVSTMSSLYQSLMLTQGYFVRGGLAHGFNMIDDNFIFSDALVKAVEIEKESIYPRITIESELIKIIDSHDNPYKSVTTELYIKDWSGCVFLNPYNQVSRKDKIAAIQPQKHTEEIKTNFLKDSPNYSEADYKGVLKMKSDEELHLCAQEYLNNGLKKYITKPRVYEKYLWGNEFLNWIEKRQSELKFTYLY